MKLSEVREGDYVISKYDMTDSVSDVIEIYKNVKYKILYIFYSNENGKDTTIIVVKGTTTEMEFELFNHETTINEDEFEFTNLMEERRNKINEIFS